MEADRAAGKVAPPLIRRSLGVFMFALWKKAMVWWLKVSLPVMVVLFLILLLVGWISGPEHSGMVGLSRSVEANGEQTSQRTYVRWPSGTWSPRLLVVNECEDGPTQTHHTVFGFWFILVFWAASVFGSWAFWIRRAKSERHPTPE